MEDYFRYCSPDPLQQSWDMCVTGAGVCHTPPGSPYPPHLHPEDHRLDWRKGRILDALQIVMITAGQGSLETRALGKRRVSGGMAILVLPGMWHRYRPDSETGWSESWVEIQSRGIDALRKAGQLAPRSILCRGVLEAGLDDCLDAIHRRLRDEANASDLEVAGLALQALAICLRGTTVRPRLTRIEQAVRQAERHFARHAEQAISVERVAAELGVAYSHFRSEFRRQTGLTPWKYVVRLRLMRARRLLGSSDAKLDDVAELVGFSSAFHLSRAFKQAYGHSPSDWRRQVRAAG
jgi:AraC-like DNA-binding protein